MLSLKTLTLEVTTFCQANCIVCVRDKLNFKLGSMPQALFEKAVTEADSLYSSLCVGGGVCSILTLEEWGSRFWMPTWRTSSNG